MNGRSYASQTARHGGEGATTETSSELISPQLTRLSLLPLFSCGTVKCQHPTARVRNAMEKKRIDEFLEGTDEDEEE